MRISLLQANSLHIPIADKKVQMIVTSPPYFAQRVYEDAVGQIGWEETADEFTEALVAVFRECKRILRDDGVLWLNLGDSHFSVNRGTGGPSDKQTSNKGSRFKARRMKLDGVVKPKDLIGIPWRVALALQRDGWYIRADVIWNKPNVMPTSATDRPTISHEYIFLLSKSRRYFYDQDAVREPYTEKLNRWGGDKLVADGKSDWSENTGQESYRPRDMRPNKKGRNRRTLWEVNTVGFSGAHFATFPMEIPEICIKAGSAVGDIVLDPFGGTGTTAIVANQLGRHGVSLDLSRKYCRIARGRSGLTALNAWEHGKDGETDLSDLPMFQE